jgi:hypothetical protein
VAQPECGSFFSKTSPPLFEKQGGLFISNRKLISGGGPAVAGH